MLTFDIRRRRWSKDVDVIRLEMPGAKVNLTRCSLAPTASAAPIPNAIVPTGTGGQAHGELTAINRHQFLFLERDGNGDGAGAPRFKKLFLLDTRHGDVTKTLLADLMAVPDPDKVGGDGDYFRFPFVTIESVYPVRRTDRSSSPATTTSRSPTAGPAASPTSARGRCSRTTRR